MQLVFIYGGPASGKYTIASRLAQLAGLPLFHNHLIVDAVHAVFPFGSDAFVRLREEFWLETFRAAISEDISLIFTFQPEASVSENFAESVRDMVEANGGEVVFIHLTVDEAEQESRITNPDRAVFGKMQSAELLRELSDQFRACEAAMPAAAITINTSTASPDEAAGMIVSLLQQS